jgi:RNase P/RNase MRP subunit p29
VFFLGKVVFEGDDFRRMLRADMTALQRLVDAKKLGVFEVKYKDGKIKVEIKKKGDDIIVKRWRPV